ncbi:hypothetical protein C8R47DRAFT_108424 [Mycena vitilis]|nr:hypothetical protein C8R47DRAFT_108424 [Mycena vitilis]
MGPRREPEDVFCRSIRISRKDRPSCQWKTGTGTLLTSRMDLGWIYYLPLLMLGHAPTAVAPIAFHVLSGSLGDKYGRPYDCMDVRDHRLVFCVAPPSATLLGTGIRHEGGSGEGWGVCGSMDSSSPAHLSILRQKTRGRGMTGASTFLDARRASHSPTPSVDVCIDQEHLKDTPAQARQLRGSSAWGSIPVAQLGMVSGLGQPVKKRVADAQLLPA